MQGTRLPPDPLATSTAGEPPLRGLAPRAACLLGPPALVALAWWTVRATWGPGIARECLAAGGLFLSPVGATVILGPAVIGESGFETLSTSGLVAVAAFMTVVSAFFWTYNLDPIERLPYVGPALQRARARMVPFLARHRWIRRLAVLGVGFFVLLPLPGSGTLGGSLMARIVGLSRLAGFLSVALGGVAVTLAYGWFGQEILRLAERYQLGTPAKVAVALVLVLVLWLVGRALMRVGRDEAVYPDPPVPPDPPGR